ncbi:YwmB family TATA-box binding protein [Haloimpatiens sp. FM7330]|uniref:YwmB family TATA-box binding protein n=1 Tax=Haloimpatiens sp. FM7330 TaxID=3298610 RepID=UPI00362E9F8A
MKDSKKSIKGIVLLLMIIVLTFSEVNSSVCKSKECDLFNDILEKCNAEVIEYGVRTSFETRKNGKEFCNFLLNKLEIKCNIKKIENNKIYRLEFCNNKINGYIQNLKEDKKNIITINIIKKDKKNNLDKIKCKISNAINCVKLEKNNTYFTYLKSKINNKNLKSVKNSINTLLKSRNVQNINTIKINNGYSTVAYTGKYDICKVNNDFIDFNYAVSAYSSGSYLIIGTPQIIINY